MSFSVYTAIWRSVPHHFIPSVPQSRQYVILRSSHMLGLELSSYLCDCQYLEGLCFLARAQSSYGFGAGGGICLQILRPLNCI